MQELKGNAMNARMKISVNQRFAAADPQNPCANNLTTNARMKKIPRMQL